MLARVARLIEEGASDDAALALDAEKARLLQRATPEKLSELGPVVEEELRAQAEAVQVAALNALAALATPEAVAAVREEALPYVGEVHLVIRRGWTYDGGRLVHAGAARSRFT